MNNENSKVRWLMQDHLSLLLNALHKISHFAKIRMLNLDKGIGLREAFFIFRYCR